MRPRFRRKHLSYNKLLTTPAPEEVLARALLLPKLPTPAPVGTALEKRHPVAAPSRPGRSNKETRWVGSQTACSPRLLAHSQPYAAKLPAPAKAANFPVPQDNTVATFGNKQPHP